MANFHSRKFFNHNPQTTSVPTRRTAADASPRGQTADDAIDGALRSVPLPDGLMTRLGLLVYTMPDEAADQVDWIGC